MKFIIGAILLLAVSAYATPAATDAKLILPPIPTLTFEQFTDLISTYLGITLTPAQVAQAFSILKAAYADFQNGVSLVTIAQNVKFQLLQLVNGGSRAGPIDIPALIAAALQLINYIPSQYIPVVGQIVTLASNGKFQEAINVIVGLLPNIISLLPQWLADILAQFVGKRAINIPSWEQFVVWIGQLTGIDITPALLAQASSILQSAYAAFLNGASLISIAQNVKNQLLQLINGGSRINIDIPALIAAALQLINYIPSQYIAVAGQILTAITSGKPQDIITIVIDLLPNIIESLPSWLADFLGQFLTGKRQRPTF